MAHHTDRLNEQLLPGASTSTADPALVEPADLAWDLDAGPGDDLIAQMDPPTQQELDEWDAEDRWNAVHQVLHFLKNADNHLDKTPELVRAIERAVAATHEVLDGIADRRIDSDVVARLPKGISDYLRTDARS